MICSPLPACLGFDPKFIVISRDFGSGLYFLVQKRFAVGFRQIGFRYPGRNTGAC